MARFPRRRAAAGRRRIEPTPHRLAHDCDNDQRGHDPDRAEHAEGGAPVVRGRDGRAEGDAQRQPDRRTEIEEAERRASPAGGKVVRDDGVRRRHAARLAHAHQHPRQRQLRIARRHAAGHRRRAPQRAGDCQHAHAVDAIGQPADGNREHAIEEREVQSADQPELPVGDAEIVLDRLRENRQELSIQEVDHIDEAQDRQRDPGPRIRPTLRRQRSVHVHLAQMIEAPPSIARI